jgi:DNA ligase-1
LDLDIFAFDPKEHISTATWPRSGSGQLQIPYSFLVAAFVLVSATRSRLSIVTVLTNTLRTVVEYQPEILRETVYLVGSYVHRALVTRLSLALDH